MSAHRALPAAMALGALLTFAGTAAAAEAPRWEIISSPSPTNLEVNSPRSEVQQVTVDATGGAFKLGVASTSCNSGTPQFTANIAFNATAEVVQAALEAVSCDVGPGGVTVSGGPGGASPYVVTFTGEHADQPFPAMTVNSAALTGSSATAHTSQLVRGAFPPYLTVTAINVGGAATDGSTITVADTLEAPLTATEVTGYDAYASFLAFNGQGGAPMSCSAPPTLTCSYGGAVDPGDMLVMRIPLIAGQSLAPTINNHATVSGGGAAQAAVANPITIGSTQPAFGPAPGTVIAATSSDHAGAHTNVTTAFTLATREPDAVAGQPKDIRFDLPPGLVGNTVGMPRCTMGKVIRLEQERNGCPSDTMVGMAVVTINSQAGAGAGEFSLATPVYNIAPSPGEPAAFGFAAIKLPVRLDTSVLSNGDYGVRVTAPNLTEATSSLAASVTIWGVPADHSGPGPNGEITFFGQQFGAPNPGQTRQPLLSNPQQCTDPLTAAMSTDSWASPGNFVSSGPIAMGRLTGCDQLLFEPSFTTLPDTLKAGAPAGYTFELTSPQEGEPDTLATPNIRNVRLTLPAGTVLSPSAATGLLACTDAQFFGAERAGTEPAQPGACAPASQVGHVSVTTPALALPLQGELYLGAPECDPCTPEDAQDGKMIRLFLQVASEGESAIVIKLEGRGTINQATGQITTTFENNPQLPFSNLSLNLNGGPKATLANPRTCGTASSSLRVTPWSAPFTSDFASTDDFEVNADCFGAQFDPSFVAGTSNVQAGEYSPFTVSFARQDHDEFLSKMQIRTPPGLLAMIGAVPLCREPRAALGTCTQESMIGHAQVAAGPGSEPYLLPGGEVFLTDGYHGAPFGLSIVEPATAGPYTLAGTTGHGTVVVRAAVDVDPHTAQVTVTSDPLPSQLDGIPLQLKLVNVTIDRGQFMFNPTNCGRQTISGTVSSLQGASAAVSSPFAVSNCATLPFKPTFKASTAGHVSKANGAPLDVRVSSHGGPQPGGGEANIAKVKVTLPSVLPTRLETLHGACLAATFEANPTLCPARATVGTATVSTPILAYPLSGPAILVSHGGQAFPDLDLVLQGEGITLVLVGNTFISKSGITTSTFNAVPDAPINSFELKLPTGRYSILGAYAPGADHYNLCGRSLNMPTTIRGQNGASITQTTKIATNGCPQVKKATRARSLAAALQACRRKSGPGARAICARAARRRHPQPRK